MSKYDDNQKNNNIGPIKHIDHELYHEEDDIAHPVIRIKRFVMPNKEEKWKILSNNKVVFEIDGNKINKSYKEYLRTTDGIKFLLNEYKNGLQSISSLKEKLKKITSEFKNARRVA